MHFTVFQLKLTFNLLRVEHYHFKCRNCDLLILKSTTDLIDEKYHTVKTITKSSMKMIETKTKYNTILSHMYRIAHSPGLVHIL